MRETISEDLDPGDQLLHLCLWIQPKVCWCLFDLRLQNPEPPGPFLQTSCLVLLSRGKETVTLLVLRTCILIHRL